MSGAAAGAQAALINAIRASGVIVRVEPDDFLELLHRQEGPLVVHSSIWIFRTSHQYLTSYKGLAFFAKSSEELSLPDDVELVEARRMWIPGN